MVGGYELFVRWSRSGVQGRCQGSQGPACLAKWPGRYSGKQPNHASKTNSPLSHKQPHYGQPNQIPSIRRYGRAHSIGQRVFGRISIESVLILTKPLSGPPVLVARVWPPVESDRSKLALHDPIIFKIYRHVLGAEIGLHRRNYLARNQQRPPSIPDIFGHGMSALYAVEEWTRDLTGRTDPGSLRHPADGVSAVTGP
ncbi:hypothetical protein VUR80DRAFT_7374 [Thermomyces stellatus]